MKKSKNPSLKSTIAFLKMRIKQNPKEIDKYKKMIDQCKEEEKFIRKIIK